MNYFLRIWEWGRRGGDDDCFKLRVRPRRSWSGRSEVCASWLATVSVSCRPIVYCRLWWSLPGADAAVRDWDIRHTDVCLRRYTPKSPFHPIVPIISSASPIWRGDAVAFPEMWRRGRADSSSIASSTSMVWSCPSLARPSALDIDRISCIARQAPVSVEALLLEYRKHRSHTSLPDDPQESLAMVGSMAQMSAAVEALQVFRSRRLMWLREM